VNFFQYCFGQKIWMSCREVFAIRTLKCSLNRRWHRSCRMKASFGTKRQRVYCWEKEKNGFLNCLCWHFWNF
jgi:hypothetical protein